MRVTSGFRMAPAPLTAILFFFPEQKKGVRQKNTDGGESY